MEHTEYLFSFFLLFFFNFFVSENTVAFLTKFKKQIVALRRPYCEKMC